MRLCSGGLADDDCSRAVFKVIGGFHCGGESCAAYGYVKPAALVEAAGADLVDPWGEDVRIAATVVAHVEDQALDAGGGEERCESLQEVC